jgi:hypothetical protein
MMWFGSACVEVAGAVGFRSRGLTFNNPILVQISFWPEGPGSQHKQVHCNALQAAVKRFFVAGPGDSPDSTSVVLLRRFRNARSCDKSTAEEDGTREAGTGLI